MKILNRIYLAWSGFWFLFSFIFLYPFFLLCIWVPGALRFSVWVNQAWCWFFFPMSFLRVKKTFLAPLPSGKPVIFCANHSSYLDIPCLTYVLPGFNAFMGKNELLRVPLFGYMFKSFHITVDRKNKNDKYQALRKSVEFVKNGRSIIIFPEGSIHSQIQPGLYPFKDGAFRIAIECQIPIVPITIPNNWYILPDDGTFMARHKEVKVIIHPHISTEGLDFTHTNELKDKVFNIIATELEKHNPK